MQRQPCRFAAATVEVEIGQFELGHGAGSLR
jgi:hypothetical protein